MKLRPFESLRRMNSDVFTPHLLLTDRMCYRPAAYRLRKVGLTLKMNYPCKRTWLHQPFVVALVVMAYVIKCGYYLRSRDKQISIYFGEFSQFMDLSFHFDGVTMLFFSLIVVSQAMYWANYRKGIEPTFLRVFYMISGLVTPASVGLTDVAQVKKLVARTRFLFRSMDIILKVTVPIIGSFMVLTPYYRYCEPLELFQYGVPNTVHFIFSCYYCGINFYQFVYFYLICYYLKIKIRNTNKQILEIVKTKEFRKVSKLLKQLDNIYTEIDEYNRTYFAKFLLLFWVTIGSVFVLLLFGAIFQDEYMIYKILFYYNSVLFAGCIALVIFTASSLNSEAFNSYKILNSMISTNYKHLFFRKLTSLSTKFKVNSFIARISDKRVGFTCWRLFTINYFRSYELIAFICVLFLKIIEISNNAEGQEIVQIIVTLSS